MLGKLLICVIGIVITINCNNLNASNTINNNSLKEELNKETLDNAKHNQQYWDEFLPTIKCDAKETLKDRFEYCTNNLINLLNNDFYIKVRAIDHYAYDIDNIEDIIDMDNIKNEIKLRKDLLNCPCTKEKLKGRAWSTISIKLLGYNEDHQNKMGKILFYDTRLFNNHWDMKFDKGFHDIRLNFYPSYEYQEPRMYTKSLDSEKTLSICLSAIEMDLLTSNSITSNIELFANHLITRKNKCAVEAINRYEKYFTPEQNARLANHIISCSLSSLNSKKNNILKYLINKYLLDDLFKNMKPNKFLNYIKKYKPEDWFDVIIKHYLNDEFGTDYNKDYLKSMQSLLIDNLQSIKEIALPKFRKYVTSVITKLVEINKKIMNCDNNYLKKRNTNTVNIPLDDKEYTSGILALNALNGASAGHQSGTKTTYNIINYLDLLQKNK